MGRRPLSSLVLTLLNLTSCISCLAVSLVILKHGSLLIVEPNLVVLMVEVAMASAATLLNGRRLIIQLREGSGL